MEIAVIAHDGKKAEMIQFLMNHKEIILANDIQLIATGTTGAKAIQAGFSKVTRFLSGPQGGDAQIAGRVAEGKTKLVFFFRDPLAKHPHEPDISMLMRLCDVHDVPLATNLSTANLIMKAVF